MEYDAKTKNFISRVARLVKECAVPDSLPDSLRISEDDTIRDQIQNLRLLKLDHEPGSEMYTIIDSELGRLRQLRVTYEIENHYQIWNSIEVRNATEISAKEKAISLLSALGQIVWNVTCGYPTKSGLSSGQIIDLNEVFIEEDSVVDSRDDNIVTQHRASREDIEKWESVLSTASLRSAMRKRLIVWLRRVAGEKISVLEAEYPGRNINRDVREARAKDVPTMMREFPTLPSLEG